MDHLIQRRGDQSAKANQIGLLLEGGLEDFFRRHHDAQIDDFIIIAAEHDANDIFADVMHIAFYGGHDDASLGFVIARRLLLFFHERQKISYRLFHHASTLDYLR